METYSKELYRGFVDGRIRFFRGESSEPDIPFKPDSDLKMGEYYYSFGLWLGWKGPTREIE